MRSSLLQFNLTSLHNQGRIGRQSKLEARSSLLEKVGYGTSYRFLRMDRNLEGFNERQYLVRDTVDGRHEPCILASVHIVFSRGIHMELVQPRGEYQEIAQYLVTRSLNERRFEALSQESDIGRTM